MSAARCAAAHPDDPTPCQGPHDAVTVLDAHNHGVTGCVHHAARLLASLVGGRVYSGSVQGAAITVFNQAGQLQPFPWLAERPPVTPRRIVHIDTLDQDLVTVRCPQWCTGEMHQVGGYKVDITHTSAVTEIIVDTSRGPVQLLGLSLEERPFTEGPPGTGVFVSVEIGGDHYPHDVADLDRLAARLVEIAGEVRAQARQLAALQAEEEQR